MTLYARRDTAALGEYYILRMAPWYTPCFCNDASAGTSTEKLSK